MKKLKAFTLIELLIVIVIIAILVTIALFGLTRARAQANRAKIEGAIKNIATLAHSNYSEINSFNIASTGSNYYTDYTKYINDIANAKGTGERLNFADDEFIIAYQAPTLNTWFCADSSGFAGRTSAVTSAMTACPR